MQVAEMSQGPGNGFFPLECGNDSIGRKMTGFEAVSESIQ